MDDRITSPNAPFPINFTVRKSFKPILVLRSLRNIDSVLPSCWSCLLLRSSDMFESFTSLVSTSTRLRGSFSANVFNRKSLSEQVSRTSYFVERRLLLLTYNSFRDGAEMLWPWESHPLKIQQQNVESKHNQDLCLLLLLDSLRSGLLSSLR